MIEKEYIRKCVGFVEKKFARGKSTEWKHSDFVLLSDKIYDETNILISVTSLKRLCGKTKSTHYPQMETRNALAKYAGFESWDDFVRKNRDSTPQITRRSVKNISIISAVVLGIVGMYFILSNIQIKGKTTDEFRLATSAITGTSPHTVVFNYEIPEVKEPVYIDYDDSFSSENREVLDPTHNTITHFYKLPDLYRVSIIYEDKIVTTKNIHLKTDDWTAFYIDNENQIYQKIDNFLDEEHFMHVSPDILRENGIEINQPAYQIKFRFITDFGVNLNACSFKTRVMNNKVNDHISCNIIGLTLLGENGKIKIIYSTEKCFNKALLQIGQKIENGHYEDLSAFDLDFSYWRELEIKTQNNKVKFYADDQYISEREFDLEMGMLKGILIITDGWWAIDNVILHDDLDQVIYDNEF